MSLLQYTLQRETLNQSLKTLTNKYLKWCGKHGYNFSEEKAFNIHTKASSQVGVISRSDTAKLLVKQAVAQLQATSAALAALKRKLQSLAETLLVWMHLPASPVLLNRRIDIFPNADPPDCVKRFFKSCPLSSNMHPLMTLYTNFLTVKGGRVSTTMFT